MKKIKNRDKIMLIVCNTIPGKGGMRRHAQRPAAERQRVWARDRLRRQDSRTFRAREAYARANGY